MKIIDKNKKISIKELEKMAENMFGNLVKAVVDVEKEIVVVGAELHADEESFLLEKDSKQKNLWGFNIYPKMTGDDFIEFDSMINLRPSQNNRSREIEDKKTREKIIKIINSLIKK